MSRQDQKQSDGIQTSSTAPSDALEKSSSLIQDLASVGTQRRKQIFPEYSLEAALLYSEARMNKHSLSDRRRQQIRALMQQFESISVRRDDSAAARKRRVLQIDAEVTSTLQREIKGYCNCRQSTTIVTEHLDLVAAMMELPCPVHGLRRLGIIIRITGDGDPREQLATRLIREYYRRFARKASQDKIDG